MAVRGLDVKGVALFVVAAEEGEEEVGGAAATEEEGLVEDWCCFLLAWTKADFSSLD